MLLLTFGPMVWPCRKFIFRVDEVRWSGALCSLRAAWWSKDTLCPVGPKTERSVRSSDLYSLSDLLILRKSQTIWKQEVAPDYHAS